MLNQNDGVLGRQGMAEPAVSHLHGREPPTVLGVKGNAVVRIDVAVEKGCDLGRETEGFIQGRAREAEFQEVRKEGQVRACPSQVAAAGLIPGMLHDRADRYYACPLIS